MDILFFAAIAVFIFFKLREQLGKVDEEQKRESIRKFIKEQTKIIDPNKEAKIIQLNKNKELDPESQKIINSLPEGLKTNFQQYISKTKVSPVNFVIGAKSAFEFIISSFSSGDINALKPLLSEKILSSFSKAIEERKSKNEILNTKIISIDESNIIDAKMEGNFVIISIQFKSKQINYVQNNKEELVSGHKTEINSVIDNWTFKKNYRSTNPNWLVVNCK